MRTEQYYIDLFKPEYNIRTIASNSGLKRSDASKERMRAKKLGTLRSDETKARMSVNRANSQAVVVTDEATGEVTELPSMRKAAVMLGVSSTVVSTYIKKQDFYKANGYRVTKKAT